MTYKTHYMVAGIGLETIVMAGIEKDSIEVPKRGIDRHKRIPVEEICEECEQWNMYDEKSEEYFCPICDS